MTNFLQRKKVLIFFAFISVYVIWGSGYLLNKIAVQELDPLMLASVRFMTSGVIIFLISILLKFSLKISKKQLINSIIAGFLFLSFGNGMLVWALLYVDSSFAALEISAQPLIILILMRIIYGTKIKQMSIIGIVLGFIGIYLLVGQKEILEQDNSILGMTMIFLCMTSWALGSLFVAKADLPKNFFVNTGYQMITGGFTLLIFSLLINEKWIWPNEWELKTQYSVVFLILFASIIAFTSFNYLLKVVSPEKVATSTYVNPIVALFLGWYFLNEKITNQSLIASIILLTGVYFINSKKKIQIFSRFKSKN
ncbi:MAG: EamA family transporter [Flavobacteriaceae bacterium]